VCHKRCSANSIRLSCRNPNIRLRSVARIVTFALRGTRYGAADQLGLRECVAAAIAARSSSLGSLAASAVAKH
jgi:hypothetical protein